jgi:hypothetical protein
MKIRGRKKKITLKTPKCVYWTWRESDQTSVRPHLRPPTHWSWRCGWISVWSP